MKMNLKIQFKRHFVLALFMIATIILPFTSYAHCDSYDGPVIKDAYKALQTKNVEPVLKWISADHEEEITKLFGKTLSLKSGDQQVYEIVETYFLETLVRLHREGEGAPYTGLKPSGTIKPIVVLSDKALAEKDFDSISKKIKAHFEQVLRTKYQMLIEKSESKDLNAEKGREYVAAYVDYTHFLEAIHDVIDGVQGHIH